MSRLFFFIFFLLLMCDATAQTAMQYSFTHYSTTTGLLSNQINSVVQDEDGYIWSGSTDGLQRFDGIRYKSFRHKKNDNTTISTNIVWQLLIDADKNLWVLTGDGKAGIFNTKTFIFHEVLIRPLREKSIRTAIKRLIKDESGNVFLLLGGGEVMTWDKTKNEFSAAGNFFLLKPEWRIADFIQQPGTEKYWISIQGGGVAIYNHRTKTLSYAGNNAEHEKIIDEFENKYNPSNFMFDKKGRLWFDTWATGFPYVFCYDLKTNKFIVNKYEFITELKSYNEVHGFVELSDGSIWVKGLQVFAKFNEQNNKFELVHNGYINERSIAYEEVRSVYEDREKNIWVSTSNNGLYRFNPAQQYFTNITHIQRVSGNPGYGSPMSFAETKWGTILVGTWGDGIYHYDRNFNALPINIKGIDEKISLAIWNMFVSKDSNTIWLAAQPGLYKIDQNKRTAKYFNPPVMENRTVRQIAEDKYGNLWMGMQGTGVYKWDAAKGKRNFNEGVKKIKNIPPLMVNKIVIDSKGYIWIVMAAGGVYVIDPATENIVMHFGKNETGERKLSEDDGYASVLEYDDITTIISNATNVFIYNRVRKKIKTISLPDLFSGFIAAVERDKNGYLWIASTSGLYRLNINKNILVRFSKEDGIDNENFTLSSSLQLKDGRIVFGSSNQFIAFDPLAVHINNTAPDITITDFKVHNTSFLVDSLLKLDRINLKDGNNSILIEFSSLRYSSACIIRYKMENLDKEWHIADKNFQAVYSYLPSGTYTFLLRSENEEGQQSNQITKLVITVQAPFWKTGWFLGILVLVAAVLIYWFDKERMNRKEAMQKMRTDIADNLHHEINTALNNINILSEMAKLKAEKDPQKSKEYIEQINNKSHNMIISMDDMLWSINPDNDNMKKTVERMREYIDALQNRHKADIEMLVDKKVESLSLNMKLRHEAFLLFKEGLKSLVSTGTRKCAIHLGLEKTILQFTIQFNNEGCDMQLLNSLLQRQDMERRLQSIHAELNIQVHKSSSVIFLKIPLDK